MHCGIVPDAGVLGFDKSFDSCITTTLTLFLSSSTSSSVSFLPIPLPLFCRTLNVLSPLMYSADGAGVGGGDGGNCWFVEPYQGSLVHYLLLRYCAALKSPEHFACTHPEYMLYG